MAFRCSRRNILLCSKSRCGEFLLGISAFFLMGYFVGILIRDEPMPDLSMLPERSYVRNVERISESEEHQDAKTTESAEYISSLNKTWLTWDSIDSPGVYRACVKRPEEEHMRDVVTGDQVLEKGADRMTIEACIDVCIQLVFTYAALSRGSECYCTDVSSSSPFLSYVDSSLCDKACTGDKAHSCGGEKYMSVYRTAVPDARCTHITLGSPGTFPLLALASFPRSGNTWSRQLIEKATGIYTGSVYWTAEKLMEISRQVFPGGNIDYRDKRTICVKTHKYDKGHVRQFEGVVLLIRNPYRAIVAEVFRKQLFESNVSPDKAVLYFKSQDWEKFVTKAIGNWKSMYLQWTQTHKRCLPIFYEELENDTISELTRIVRFLNQSVDSEKIACAAQEHPSSLATGTALGNHGRKTRVYLTTDPFSARMRERVDKSIRVVNSTLYKNYGIVMPKEYLESVDVF